MKLKIIAALALACFARAVSAQKVAPEQKNSLRAPANIRIDGKVSEWNDKFQAYSHHTQFYYTLSNDNRYLYITIQAVQEDIINRILIGGITLTINKSGVKKDTAAIHITYPIVKDLLIFQKNAPKVKADQPASAASLDSFVNVTNAQLESKAKVIRVTGVKGIDTLVSVYNLDGIKAATAIDDKIHLNCELAVSLKNLGLDINNPIKFAYRLMINEANIAFGRTDSGIAFTISTGRAQGGQAATDFWGEYMLAK